MTAAAAAAAVAGEEIEKDHVHKVYSEIAAHFSDTRFKAWPRIAAFLEEQPAGSLIADVGCGNGKYLGVNGSVAMLGSDICPELVSIGRRRGYEVLVCDCLNLPYHSDRFDSVICIAVVHHLSTEDRRQKAVREMARVLLPGGSMLLYVWAMEQDKRKFDSQDVMVPWHLQPKYRGRVERASKEPKTRVRKPKKGKIKQRRDDDKTGKRVEDQNLMSDEERKEETAPRDECGVVDPFCDLLLDTDDFFPNNALKEPYSPSCCERLDQDEMGKEHLARGGAELETEVSASERLTKSEKLPHHSSETSEGVPKSLEDQGYSTYQRYYHVFKEGELASLVEGVSGLAVKQEFYDHENWCVVAIKTK